MNEIKLSPLVSVVIPLYNEEKRIERCVKAIQDQTYKNLEIIVVDDGSTDNSLDVVKKMQLNDSRIVIYENKHKEKRTNWRGYDINAGYRARLIGFEKARGGWITTQDADDSTILNRIEIQLKLAEKYNATMVLIQWMQLTSGSENKIFDLEQYLQDIKEEDFVNEREKHVKRTIENRGILMREPFHFLIPFPFKWFPYTRKLFYKKTEPFLGADNCMFFRKEVILSGVNFRHRNYRTWGTPAGRGSGRDFAYNVTNKFKNTLTFNIPLYLWDVKSENADFKIDDYKKYLKYK